MDEHVEPDILLPADRARGLVLQKRLVGGVSQRAFDVRGAGIPDFGSLRKPADGRGREGWQLEALRAGLGALGERAGAARIGVIDAARRAATAGSWILDESGGRRPPGPSTADGRDATRPPFSAFASAASSSIFCTGKPTSLISGSSPVSSARSIGRGAASRRARRTRSGRVSRPRVRAGQGSGSNRPARCCGRRSPERQHADFGLGEAVDWSGARTRSRCRPATGSASAVSRLSPSPPK